MPDPVLRNARIQDPKNRQSSVNVGIDDPINTEFLKIQNETWDYCYKAYEDLLEKGVAKEQARCLLPEGLNPTRMYMKNSIRGWVHYCGVRCGVETQFEHRVIAKEIASVLSEELPDLASIFEKMLEYNYSAETQ